MINLKNSFSKLNLKDNFIINNINYLSKVIINPIKMPNSTILIKIPLEYTTK